MEVIGGNQSRNILLAMKASFFGVEMPDINASEGHKRDRCVAALCFLGQKVERVHYSQLPRRTQVGSFGTEFLQMGPACRF